MKLGLGIGIPHIINSAEFDPFNFAGLSLCLDASDTASIIDSGDPFYEVEAWSDKSESSNDALKIFEKEGPVTGTASELINGLNTIKFNGIDQFLKASAFIYLLNGATVFIVAKGPGQVDKRILTENSMVNNLSFYSLCQSDNSSGDKAKIFIRDDGGNVKLDTTGSTTVFDDMPFVYTVIDTGAMIKFYLNGVENFNEVYSRNTSTFDTLGIGAVTRLDGELSFFEGLIGTILVYDRIFSEGERMAVEAGLSKKWGVPTTFPYAFSSAFTQDFG